MSSSGNFWCKLDRFAAWVALLGFVLYFISGYGMTKEIISGGLASTLHNDILPPIVVVFFIIHTSYATRLAFIRWRFWNWFSKIMWGLFFVFIAVGFIYVEYLYERPTIVVIEEETEVVVDTNVDSNTTSTISPSAQATTEEVKLFSTEELAQYDGQNGNPPYVAVDGVVYDMSGVFADGKHYQHFAGQELTSEFYSRHSSEDITKYPVVGKMQ